MAGGPEIRVVVSAASEATPLTKVGLNLGHVPCSDLKHLATTQGPILVAA
jgi:hypothetical protein